jgi:hypothetical protein
MTKQVRQVSQARPAQDKQPATGARLAVVGRAAVTWLRSVRGAPSRPRRARWPSSARCW